jgi:bifunctional enzyme CysN/CysC
MELLRLATAGSVDDGKSTLIGRLLFDSKAIFEDQLASVERASLQRGHEYTNLALLTDGLRAEREQGITIDVAYRYFATPRRKFIIADTPGHVQYTRNMVTGASTADVAVILVDARKGLLEQSRRHAFIATLLRIPHLVVAVNKMDLVAWDEDRFRSIVADFSAFADSLLEVADVTFIPLSALQGDNVVDRSDRMPWYAGLPLLEHLETVHIAEDRNLVDMRFPVQYVIRPMSDAHHDYRGYAGQVAGGVLRAGDDVVVLPSGLRSRVAGIDTYDGPVEEAFTGMSVTVRLADDVDVSRGDMLVRAGLDPTSSPPSTSQDVEAVLCWMVDQPLRHGGRYAIKHTTRWARAVVADLAYRLDVNTLSRDEAATELALNEIGRVRLRITAPLMHDPYGQNRTTGSFILVDEATNTTAGAGMIVSD